MHSSHQRNGSLRCNTTETWHSCSDDLCLPLGTPAGYAVVDVARTSARGGGVAIIFCKQLKCSRLVVPAWRTLEVICIRLTTPGGPVIVVNIYRPVSEKPSTLFFDELASVLETLVSYSSCGWPAKLYQTTVSGTKTITIMLQV